MKFKELMAEIEKKNNEVSAIFDEVDTKHGGVIDSATKSKVISINKEIEQLELRAVDLKEGEDLRAANEKRRQDAAAAKRLQVGSDKGDGPPNPSERFREARKSITEQMLADAAFKSWRDPLLERGYISKDTRIDSPRVHLRTLITGLSDTSGGAMVQTDYKPFVNIAPYQPLTLFDLVTNGETSSDLIEYARITGYTNNAASVAEATATDDGSGYKPESAMAFDKVTEAVKTIAHWIPATTRAIQDAGQLRTMVENFLTWGLRQEMEDQMLNGDGSGENFTGIHNVTGILTQAYTTSLLVTTRKARTKLKTQGRVMPSGWLFSPNDWEAFDLLTDGENRYFFGGPSILGNPRLWGIPVVENESQADGEGLLGDFRYAILWQRMQAMISMSNSHSDFFVRNLVAILAEERAAFGVTYPKAFVEIDLTP